jgi:hypothetical protein
MIAALDDSDECEATSFSTWQIVSPNATLSDEAIGGDGAGGKSNRKRGGSREAMVLDSAIVLDIM